jgi:hypothetical protein
LKGNSFNSSVSTKREEKGGVKGFPLAQNYFIFEAKLAFIITSPKAMFDIKKVELLLLLLYLEFLDGWW